MIRHNSKIIIRRKTVTTLQYIASVRHEFPERVSVSETQRKFTNWKVNYEIKITKGSDKLSRQTTLSTLCLPSKTGIYSWKALFIPLERSLFFASRSLVGSGLVLRMSQKVFAFKTVDFLPGVPSDLQWIYIGACEVDSWLKTEIHRFVVNFIEIWLIVCKGIML